jgi:CRP-like cAMP-binding protein
VEIINHIGLFEDFNLDELNVLCHYMNCYAASRNCTLLEEGADGDFLLLILSGSVSVSKLISPQETKVIAEAKIGDTLGELSLIDGRPRFASCHTNTPTDFAVLTRESLNEILVHHPRLGNKFLLVLLQRMAVRLRETCDRFLSSDYSGII